MLRWIWLPFAIGCSFDHGVAPGGGVDGGAGADAAKTTNDSLTVGANCWVRAELGLDICLADPPTGSVTVSSDTSIDTDASGTGALECKALVAGSTNVCVIAASTIMIDSMRTLSAHGMRPLVLIATTITIDGTIDVASHIGGQQGPASDLPGCSNGMNATRSGGGQGGSFGGKGGDGGDEGGRNGSRGLAGDPITPTTLRGGCRGGSGGGGNGGSHGGGAVALFATTLTFGASGTINASGAGAQGGDVGREGGSGAGSGGMIVLTATTINVDPSTEIFANGGHGGGGSDGENGGSDGTDPTSPTSGGSGGAGAGSGSGGTGYPASSRDGQSGDDGEGGGGGGGGAGLIRVFSSSSVASAQVSPPPT